MIVTEFQTIKLPVIAKNEKDSAYSKTLSFLPSMMYFKVERTHIEYATNIYTYIFVGWTALNLGMDKGMV